MIPSLQVMFSTCELAYNLRVKSKRKTAFSHLIPIGISWKRTENEVQIFKGVLRFIPLI